MVQRKKNRNYLSFKRDFTIGDLDRLVAESDDHLAQYYVDQDAYVMRALNRDDDASVFIGPKGAGKSAILQMVRLTKAATGDTNRLIEIAPDDLAFNALVNIGSRTPLLNSAGEHQWLFTSLWDYVLSIEIIRRESPSSAGIARILRKLFGTRHEREQQQLLDITISDNGRLSTMTSKMLELVRAIEFTGKYATSEGTMRVEVENGSPAADLKILQLINNVAKNLPRAIGNEYYVLVDDLDLHWTGSPIQNAFLGAMFLSMRKLSRSRNIKFVVSLRHNIYRKIHLEERDKFSTMVCDVVWGAANLKRMVHRRLAYILNVSEAEVWGGLFPSGAFEDFKATTDGTPRDLIRLSVECVKVAQSNDHQLVEPDDIYEGRHRFSKARLDDLGSQYMYYYPNLSVVLKQFAGGPKHFPLEHVQEAAFRVAEIAERGPSEAASRFDWAIAGMDKPLALARILLEIGFLRLKDGRDADPKIADEDDLDMLAKSNWYAIHPMYASGLGLIGTAHKR